MDYSEVRGPQTKDPFEYFNPQKVPRVGTSTLGLIGSSAHLSRDQIQQLKTELQEGRNSGPVLAINGTHPDSIAYAEDIRTVEPHTITANTVRLIRSNGESEKRPFISYRATEILIGEEAKKRLKSYNPTSA